jgi:HAD superfamily hydrolase (TIGR01490 family)
LSRRKYTANRAAADLLLNSFLFDALQESSMQLAIFDLDNTLLEGDSDYEWGQYLVNKGLVDREYFSRENRRFFEQYQAGSLDIHEYARFVFKPLMEHPREALERWRREFIAAHIEPMIRAKGRALLTAHREQGHTLLIMTSTNRFIAAPIAEALGVDHLIATEPAEREGRYTGEIAGEPCLGPGKLVRLNSWLEENRISLECTWFYSDSHNDIPLLSWVKHPVAVDPDERLRQHALAQGWPMISLARIPQ